MTEEEFDGLAPVRELSTRISATELTDQTDRTLLYGYDSDRHTTHVYLQDGLIHYYKPYTYSDSAPYHVASPSWDAEMIVPVKRTYPALCDAEFCALLLSKGISPNFTSWGNKAADRYPFAGVIYPELEK